MVSFSSDQIRFDIVSTDIPLGDGLGPDFVLRNHASMCLDKNCCDEEYKDEWCFFHCLAYTQDEQVPALVDQCLWC